MKVIKTTSEEERSTKDEALSQVTPALLIEFSRVNDIHDLIKNKEQLNREGEKSLMDKMMLKCKKKSKEERRALTHS